MGMFDKAKTIAPAPKKALKASKAEIQIEGIEHLAMVDAMQDALKAIRTTLEGQVKGKASELFLAHIEKTGQRPENFTAIEGGAFASMQLRRRSTQYGLSEEAVQVLRAAGIEPGVEIIVPEMFGINPTYAGDKALLAKVEKAIAKIVPEDFIIHQPAQTKLLSDEATMNAAIATKNPDAVAAVTSISCGPKLKNTNMQTILDFVTGLLTTPAFGTAAEEAKVETTKKLRVVKGGR